MTKLKTYSFWLFKGSALFCLLNSLPVTAQIIPDTSLPVNSNVTSQGNTSIITGGTQARSNLFHSFEQFSIPTGGTAYFNNALNIQNIISRVTGSSVSNIDGLIRANGSANLFLLNPNGIIFGSNATLNIGGSFLASTASKMKFADSSEFNADTFQSTPLLTVSVPVGLGFGSKPGSIQVQGDGRGTRQTSALIDTSVGLQVQPERTLALIGGEVTLEGGTLKTAGGRIELGSVAGLSEVSLTPTSKGLALGYEGIQNFQDIQLSQQASVDASGVGGGDVQVQGRQVKLINGSQIENSTLGSEPGGNLGVRAKESLEIFGTVVVGKNFIPSGLSTFVYPTATGTGGSLTIDTQKLVLSQGGIISTATLGRNAGGTLNIKASDSVEVVGALIAGQPSGGIATSVAPTGTGSAGNLYLETPKLVLHDGGRISTTAIGKGIPGNLFIKAESVELSGTLNGIPTLLSAQARDIANGGNLEVNTENLSILNGARISSSNLGTGSAGGIKIRTHSMHLQNNSSVVATTRSGNGGNIELQVKNSLALLHNSLISTNAGITQGIGNGGNINIDTSLLTLAQGSKITADAIAGNGGNIQIATQGLFQPQDRSITASSQLGINGTITINTLTNNFSRAAVSLPTNVVDVTGLVAQTCAGRGDSVGEGSSFVVTGGGLPPRPTDPLKVSAVIVDANDTDVKQVEAETHWATLNSKKAVLNPIPQEAQSLIVNSQGQFILTAQPNINPNTIDSNSATCYAP